MATTRAGPGRRLTPSGSSARPRLCPRARPETTATMHSPTSAHGASGTAGSLAGHPYRGAPIPPPTGPPGGWGPAGSMAVTRNGGHRPPRPGFPLERRVLLAPLDDRLDALVDRGQHRLGGGVLDLPPPQPVQIVHPQRVDH